MMALCRLTVLLIEGIIMVNILYLKLELGVRQSYDVAAISSKCQASVLSEKYTVCNNC